MIKVIVSGCNGRMGQVVTRLCTEDADMEVVAGFDLNTAKLSTYPVYADPMEFSGSADVIIDFSNPAALSGLLHYCGQRQIPAVLCATGYSEAQLTDIQTASQSMPLFKSGNMSLGINLLSRLVKQAAKVLGSAYDVEIVERHHRNKLDAPSGTAIMLADAVKSALPYETEYVYERQSVRRPRGAQEIGISSVRGGTIVGEHEVIFAGLDEVIEFKHTAASREVFATGALRAAKFMATVQKPGLYTMDDVLADLFD